METVPENVLAAVVRFESSEPARARVRVSGPNHRFVVRERQDESDHAVAIVGLRPESEYRFTVELGSDGPALAPVTFTTGALPPYLPPIEVVENQKSDT
ncbi:MAG TPA: aryl-sulfate sulfotransferase N-terminal domain-containing protein, partial [Acidimicrobiia bacterium]|nr:aryl-sulfate sulfotransferase N-terminal domain-containing protein [Acidimicrobiia bacterium]